MTTPSGETRNGWTLSAGTARGRVIRLEEPLSLWGGIDPGTGRVIDRRHPQAGENLAGRVVLMPSGRGSSSSSSVLAEAVRAGTSPAAILLLEPDPILALGAVVAATLYRRLVPVVVLDEAAYWELSPDDVVVVEAGEETATVRLARAG